MAMIDYCANGDPIKNLWSAVINQAYEDLTVEQYSKKKSLRDYQKIKQSSAVNFFFSKNSSLSWICLNLGIPIKKVREKAKEIMVEEGI